MGGIFFRKKGGQAVNSWKEAQLDHNLSRGSSNAGDRGNWRET